MVQSMIDKNAAVKIITMFCGNFVCHMIESSEGSSTASSRYLWSNVGLRISGYTSDWYEYILVDNKIDV